MGPIDALPQQLRRLRLRTRFALHAILLIATLFALLVPAVLVIQESAILRTAQDNGLRLVAIFAFSSVQAVVAEDFLGLRQVVNSLGRERDVRYAMILDLDGRVLIHTRANETGARYDDPLTRRALAAAAPLFQEARSPQGEVLYDFATPVLLLNKPRAIARIGISIADERALIRRVRNTILGFGVTTLVIGLAWARVQARRLTRPLQAVAAGAAAVARGNLHHRIPVDRQDEVGGLAQAFNSMADSLRVRSEIDRELSSTLRLETVLDALVRHARHLSAADVALLAHRDPAAPFAAVAAHAGSVSARLPEWRIPAGHGRAGWVLVTGHTWTSGVSDVEPDLEEDRVVDEEGLRTLALIPILLKQSCIGVLGVGRRDVGPFHEDTLDALRRLADQAAVAIANAMAYHEIELLNVTLEARVAERTRQLSEANAALEASHEKLREFDRLKSDFVSNVSHELRTPLTAIRMSVDNLVDGVVGEISAPLQRYLGKVKSNTDRLVRLINDLLDLSRIEAGRVELHRATVDVGEVLRDVAEHLRPVAAEKGLDLAATPGAAGLVMFADRDKLQQVLINLAGNALKFTPPGGSVSLSARSIAPPADRHGNDGAGPHVEIAVEDTGVGIPPEELAAIFDKFHQVRREGRHTAQGTGLGLSIAKSLIELHGGTIRVESAVGRGSRFLCLLPQPGAGAAVRTPRDDRSAP